MRSGTKSVLGAMAVAAVLTVMSDATAQAAEIAPAGPGAREFLACQRIPADERLAMRMKPHITLRHLLSYMSTVSCTPFWMEKSSQLDGWLKTVIDLEPPPTATAAEAHQYLVEALDSIGFTLQPAGRFLRVVPAPTE
jgi:hypothetical protein